MTALAGNKSRIGTAGAQELMIPVGARGAALGGASLAFSRGADAIFWNPAGVARADDNVEAMFSNMSYFADISVNYFAVAVKAGTIGSFGFSVKSLSFGDIPVTTEEFPDGTGEVYSPGIFNVGITYSNKLIDRVAIGVTANIISHSIMSTSATGIAFNFGLQYAGLVDPNLSLGLAVKNVGPGMRFDGANMYRQATALSGNRGLQYYKVEGSSFELPTSIELGVSYLSRFNDQNALTVGGNFQNNNFQDDEMKVGAEYVYNNMVFVRAGYNFAPDQSDDPTGQASYIYGLTFGLGFQIELTGLKASIDYAYRSADVLDATNTITIGLAF
jgi:hypothetical protein